MSQDVQLRISGLVKRFGGFVALNGIDLEVATGDRVGLIGPNGSGKSTLLNCLCGALRSDAGQIMFDGHVLNGMSAHQRTRLGIARTFQLPRPFSSLNLEDNVSVPMVYSVTAKQRANPVQRSRLCEELLNMVGLQGKRCAMPAGLTQIEMRKLELARAMACKPRLLVVDEAMAGLSHQEVDEIISLLFKLNGQGVTIILIEHIMRAVLAFSERLVVLVAGRKIADGRPGDVIRQPDVVTAYLGS